MEPAVDPIDWACLQQNLRLIRSPSYAIHLYKHLSNPQPQDSLLRSSMDLLSNCTVGDTLKAITQVAQHMGFIKWDSKSQDIYFYRNDANCSEHKVLADRFARVYISLFRDEHDGPPKKQSPFRDPPLVTLLCSRGRTQCRLASSYDLQHFFIALVDAEVYAITTPPLSRGSLSLETRSQTLSNFRRGKYLDRYGNEDIYLAQAVYCHDTGDLRGAVGHLAKALNLNNDFGAYTDSPFALVDLEHTKHWKLCLQVPSSSYFHKPYVLQVMLQGVHKFDIVSGPGPKGRRALADLFDIFVDAYKKEVEKEADLLTAEIRHKARFGSVAHIKAQMLAKVLTRPDSTDRDREWASKGALSPGSEWAPPTPEQAKERQRYNVKIEKAGAFKKLIVTKAASIQDSNPPVRVKRVKLKEARRTTVSRSGSPRSPLRTSFIAPEQQASKKGKEKAKEVSDEESGEESEKSLEDGEDIDEPFSWEAYNKVTLQLAMAESMGQEGSEEMKTKRRKYEESYERLFGTKLNTSLLSVKKTPSPSPPQMQRNPMGESAYQNKGGRALVTHRTREFQEERARAIAKLRDAAIARKQMRKFMANLSLSDVGESTTKEYVSPKGAATSSSSQLGSHDTPSTASPEGQVPHGGSPPRAAEGLLQSSLPHRFKQSLTHSAVDPAGGSTETPSPAIPGPSGLPETVDSRIRLTQEALEEQRTPSPTQEAVYKDIQAWKALWSGTNEQPTQNQLSYWGKSHIKPGNIYRWIDAIKLPKVSPAAMAGQVPPAPSLPSSPSPSAAESIILQLQGMYRDARKWGTGQLSDATAVKLLQMALAHDTDNRARETIRSLAKEINMMEELGFEDRSKKQAKPARKERPSIMFDLFAGADASKAGPSSSSSSKRAASTAIVPATPRYPPSPVAPRSQPTGGADSSSSSTTKGVDDELLDWEFGTNTSITLGRIRDTLDEIRMQRTGAIKRAKYEKPGRRRA